MEKIVLTSLAMHNLPRRVSPEYTAPGNIDQEHLDSGTVITGSWQRQGGILTGMDPTFCRDVPNEAKTVRFEYTKYFNQEGSVPWQERRTGAHQIL